MVENTRNPIRIDLNEFKLHFHLKKIQLTLHFNSPSRRFFLSVIALVVNEMKNLGKISSIPLERHLGQLVLLNETIGGSAGSSEKENLLPRIYRKWKDALPDLEDAPLFKVLGRRKEHDEGMGRTYPFTEPEKDSWANLFEYQGSEENVRLKFAVDRVGAMLDDVVVVYGDSLDGDAWERFISTLKGKSKPLPEAKAIQSPLEAPESRIPPIGKPKTTRQGRHRWAVFVALIVVIAAAATLATWKLYLKPAPENKASVEKMAFPLPDKPSIAVLPFVNMSKDPDQEYFSDGITEEIITALTKVPRLFVIARNSTFTYKGRVVEVKQVAEELGIRYVLEGSVQKAGEKVRITAQLIDALSGHHLWAERYDRDLRDIFALQDEITLKITTALQVKLTAGEQARLMAKGTTNLEAYLKAMQSRQHGQRQTKEGNAAARKLAEEVIALDPKYPYGYISLALCHYTDIFLGLSESPQQSLARAIELARKAISLDNSYSFAHSALGMFLVSARQYDEGVGEAERAVALDPNAAENLFFLAAVLCYAGRPEEAIPLVESAERLNPIPLPLQLQRMSLAYRSTGRYEKAIEAAKRIIRVEANNQFAHVLLISSYIPLGREKEARAEAVELLRINPNFSVDRYIKRIPYKNQAESDRLAEALYKAGLK